MKLTKITFKQLEANGDSSVWVFNQTNPKGRVHINVRENHGDPILITVENTWIPMDLTTSSTSAEVTSITPRIMPTGRLVAKANSTTCTIYTPGITNRLHSGTDKYGLMCAMIK